LHQQPLPPEYTQLSDEEVSRRIETAKSMLGDRLLILGHHYQRDEIIAHADITGDSYKLSKDAAARQDVEFIVFCGVHFMAESADILGGDNQIVILPNMAAGCSMADMANRFQVKACWRQLAEVTDTDQIIPITYVNSAASIKAFVGERKGACCTSTNAKQALEWALAQGEKILFLPDQHLGRNTAVDLGFDPDKDMVVWDPFKPLGGNTAEQINRAKFILWKGHCSVHQRFTTEQIEDARREDPQVQVLVHPECPLDVVRASDLNGSTEYIRAVIEKAEPGTSWAIGTEINLVKRLAKERPDLTIKCLDSQICPCSTMYRIHPTFLLWVLDKLVEGDVVNQVSVPGDVKKWSRVALQCMLDLNPAASLSD
jgi:quinolinate synthase